MYTRPNSVREGVGRIQSIVAASRPSESDCQRVIEEGSRALLDDDTFCTSVIYPVCEQHTVLRVAFTTICPLWQRQLCEPHITALARERLSDAKYNKRRARVNELLAEYERRAPRSGPLSSLTRKLADPRVRELIELMYVTTLYARICMKAIQPVVIAIACNNAVDEGELHALLG